MNKLMKIVMVGALCMVFNAKTEEVKKETLAPIYNIKVKTIDGKETTLKQYKGKALLIVNTASKCGFTKQYAGLQKTHEKYSEKGLVVLGFPSNNFGKQEPGTDKEIATFCTQKFAVTFPMFAKLEAKGKSIHPLYKYLTDSKSSKFGGKVTWNFNKFLISKDGKIINRFTSKDKPESEKVIKAIEATLK